MAAILKMWRQIRNPTPSIDGYLVEEYSCQISSGSDLKRRSLRLFLRGRPDNNNNNNNNRRERIAQNRPQGMTVYIICSDSQSLLKAISNASDVGPPCQQTASDNNNNNNNNNVLLLLLLLLDRAIWNKFIDQIYVLCASGEKNYNGGLRSSRLKSGRAV